MEVPGRVERCTGFRVSFKEISDSWLLRYGLDSKEIGRNFPYIAELTRKE